MAKSGIAVSHKLQEIFVQADDAKDLAWLEVQIHDEAFVNASRGAMSTPDAEFKQMAEALPKKEPSYFLYRVASEGKWLVVFWVPDVAKVKDRMVYASSIAELTKGFGEAKFVRVPVYRISEPAECTWSAYSKTLIHIDESEILTNQERVAREAHIESVQSMGSSKVSAIVGMPVKVQDGASDSIRSLRDGKCNTILLQLNQETEVLESVESCNSTLDEIPAKLTKKDPRFIVHAFTHEHDGKRSTTTVFIYYCPSGAKPRSKMFYSSCKNVIIQIIGLQEVVITKNFEFSEARDISSQAVLDELYPKEVAVQGFAKPQSQGRSKRGMIGKSKFSASPAVSPKSPSDEE